ncbi:MAG: oligosaccharide flippase family protein [Elusimicrobia bacterium]|nr:oligosaccharide flippase family protein [Elusimicrobiota bacterium]
MSVRDKLMKGSLLRVGNMGLNVLVSFLMMPMIIRVLGDRVYGVWVVVGSIVGYFGLLDFGLSSAITRFVSRAIGQGERDRLKEVTATCFYVYLAIGAVTLILTLAMAALAGRFARHPGDEELLRALILLTGLNFSLNIPVRVFNGVLSSHLRYDVMTWIDIGKTIVSAGLTLFVLRAGYGVLGIAAVQFLASQADNGLRIRAAYRMKPAPSVSPRRFKTGLSRSLFGYSVYAFVGQIADMLRFRINSVVIAAFLGAQAVTHYFIAVRLMEYFMQVMLSAVGILSPVFSRYEGMKDYKSLQEKFLLTTKISVAATVFLGGSILFFGKAFIERWMGPPYRDAYPVLVVLTLAIATDLMQITSVNVLYGISKHKFYAYANSAEGVLNLILSLAWVKPYGLMGVALGAAVPMVFFRLVVQPVYVSRAIGMGYGRYASVLARALALSLLAMAIPWAAFHRHLSNDYTNISILAGLTFMAYAMVALPAVFGRGELKLILQREASHDNRGPSLGRVYGKTR